MTSKWNLAEKDTYCLDVYEDISALPDYGGVYLFVVADGDEKKVLFVGHSENFQQTINDAHAQWAAAVELGMNQIHTLPMTYDYYREKLTRDFIYFHKPELNN